jgi:hypothetical protein
MCLTLILLTSTKWWAPASASKWQMGFDLAFKGLKKVNLYFSDVFCFSHSPFRTLQFNYYNSNQYCDFNKIVGIGGFEL